MTITLTVLQLEKIIEFIAPDNLVEQKETKVTIEYKEAFSLNTGEDELGIIEFKAGYYAYIAEYPEEGAIYLGDL